MAVTGGAAAVVVGPGLRGGGERGEGPDVSGGGQTLILDPALHDHDALSGGSGDWSRAGVGTKISSLGESGPVITDLGQDPGTGQCSHAGEAGEDRCVGVFGEDLFGCRGEMLGGPAGGVELQDQCSGLFAEGGFHAGQLAYLLAGEICVQLIAPCIDFALAASG